MMTKKKKSFIISASFQTNSRPKCLANPPLRVKVRLSTVVFRQVSLKYFKCLLKCIPTLTLRSCFLVVINIRYDSKYIVYDIFVIINYCCVRKKKQNSNAHVCDCDFCYAKLFKLETHELQTDKTFSTYRCIPIIVNNNYENDILSLNYFHT